jgi:CubicO group peptidase (beta-lactamase class C family)
MHRDRVVVAAASDSGPHGLYPARRPRAAGEKVMFIQKICSPLAAVLVMVVPVAASAQDRAALGPALDSFIEKAMDRLEVVPGLSIAVVDAQGRVHSAGFGVADVESAEPVTPDTPFYIASSTKSFTALALAAMDRRGELDLDAPLSSWSVGSPVPVELAASASLSDLLSHQSGLTSDPIAFRVAFSGEWTPDELWLLTAETRANADAPHGWFQYTNAGYNLATVLVERRWGRDWRTLVEGEVLAPLGMTATTAHIDALRSAGTSIAIGHFGGLTGPTQRSGLQKSDTTMQSAGGLMSTANDLALWLEAQLTDGVVDGRRVFPEGLIASTHVSRVEQVGRSGPYTRHGYGLGWHLGRYGDDRMIHHFGGFSGSRAHVSFMPARRLGVAVLINEDLLAGDLADLAANYVYDWFAATPDLESVYDARIDALVAQRDQRRAGVIAGREDRARRPRTLSLPDEAYTGVYISALGTLSVRTSTDGLELSIGALRAVAENFTLPESVRVELIPWQGMPAQFEVSEGLPVAVTLAGYRFVRQ